MRRSHVSDSRPGRQCSAWNIRQRAAAAAHLSVAILRVMSRMTWFAFFSEKWISSRLFSTPSICFVCPSSVVAVSVATWLCLYFPQYADSWNIYLRMHAGRRHSN